MAFCRISWTDESITSGGETNELNSSLNILEFDIVERWNQSSKADVTQYAVESGAPLTDHKKALPKEIIIDGLVSNTPLGTPPPNGKGESSRISTSFRGTGSGSNVLTFSEEFDRVQDCFDSLQHLVENPIFCTLEMPQKTYERVTVKSVEDSREAGTTGWFKGVRFRVTFQEIFVGQTQTVDIPVPLEPRGTSGRSESASSPQTTTSEPPTSWALTLGQSVGLFD